MYRAIELSESDRDLHRFVWRSESDGILIDYRMTRVTFGVSASSFAANMAVKQNAADLVHKFPLAAKAVEKSFYVDDGLTGADDVQTASLLQRQLQELFLWVVSSFANGPLANHPFCNTFHWSSMRFKRFTPSLMRVSTREHWVWSGTSPLTNFGSQYPSYPRWRT